MLLAQLWSGGGVAAGGTHVGVLLAGSSLEAACMASQCGGVRCRQSFVAPSVPDWSQLPVVHVVSCSVSLVVGVRAEC